MLELSVIQATAVSNIVPSCPLKYMKIFMLATITRQLSLSKPISLNGAQKKAPR